MIPAICSVVLHFSAFQIGMVAEWWLYLEGTIIELNFQQTPVSLNHYQTFKQTGAI